MAYRQSNGGGGANGAYSEDERDSRSGGDDRPGSDLGDKPTYMLEHLATFTVNKESGIVYPADGMRRLLLLEKTTGIWSQKMQLCLDRQWVLIMDFESGNVIERFPASLIQEPTAFTSNGPMEMYNNVLVLIVGGGANSRSEMHIFQCLSISAVLLEQDLKNLRAGKNISQRDRESVQPSAANQRKSPSASSHNRDAYNNYQHETDSDIDGLNDETSSTSSEKYEKDVTVLNHCFDDIEKFIARLQHAAAASRELEHRRRNRKSKKKDPGEGLLTLRTKPPHEKEFVDIFAKFKLSFNLLAKLKAHIHDPNAPELVHFLFTPLALIVDASHDTYYDPNIPARVINPLMTREAVNLLINCVTSKETELWRSLGDAWIIPRDQWKGNTGSYHPVFFDGWSPDYSVMDELDSPSTPTVKRRIEPRHYNNGGGDYDYEPHGDKYQSPESPSLHDFGARSEISIDSIERNGGPSGSGTVVMGGLLPQHQQQVAAHHSQEVHGAVAASSALHGVSSVDAWLGEVQARGGKLVQVTYPRTANNDKELTVVRGEYLEILDDTRKWWKARNSRGHVAHVPHTIITPFAYNDNGETFNNPLFAQNANRNFTNRQSTDSIDRYSQPIERNASPSSGLGPQAAQQVTPAPNQADWVRNKHIVAEHRGSISSDEVFIRQQQQQQPVVIPPPPPPMPPVTPVPLRTASTNVSRKSIVSLAGGQDDMHEELKTVLTLFRDKRRILDIVKTPEIYIQQSSSADEVEKWLQAKGFSDKVVKKLNGLNGNELFALKRHSLEEYCGSDEGRRLASQITIQRNISGYKTARSSELQAILAKARTKTGEM